MAKRSKKKNKRKKTRSKKGSRKIKGSRRKVRKIKSSKSKGGRSKKSIIVKDEEGNSVIKVSEAWSNQALINNSKYKKKYNLSVKENDKFWKKEGKRISWIKPYTKIKDIKYSKDEVKIKWFYDGTLNVSANCIDRHLKKNGKKTAIIWVGDDPSDTKKITYKELHKNVSKAANALKSIGIQKGDRVTIYLTMIPELAYVMLACARIGAVHSIIFGGFSPDSIATRINDCESDYLVTADQTRVMKIDSKGNVSILAEKKSFKREVSFLNDVAVSHDRKSVFVTDMGAISKMFDPDKERSLWPLESKQAKELPAIGCVYQITLDGKITDAVSSGQKDVPGPNGVGRSGKEGLLLGDFFTGNIGYMNYSNDRSHMMLTMAFERNIFFNNHIIVSINISKSFVKCFVSI